MRKAKYLLTAMGVWLLCSSLFAMQRSTSELNLRSHGASGADHPQATEARTGQSLSSSMDFIQCYIRDNRGDTARVTSMYTPLN